MGEPVTLCGGLISVCRECNNYRQRQTGCIPSKGTGLDLVEVHVLLGGMLTVGLEED